MTIAEEHEKEAEKRETISQKFDSEIDSADERLKAGDFEQFRKHIDSAETILNKGLDYERKNKLKVYQAVDAMTRRDFAKATDLFINQLETFNGAKLCSFDQMVRYCCICGVYSLAREDLKRLVASPEIIAVTDERDTMAGQFMNTLYECEYARFVTQLEYFAEWMRHDPYLSRHATHYLHSVRQKAMRQFLVSYDNVNVSRMAGVFGVPDDVMERTISKYIAKGGIEARVDGLRGVVATRFRDERAKTYQEMLRAGDDIAEHLNKVLKAATMAR